MKEKAFTLVEVLVGTFLLSVIALGVYGAFSFGVKTSTHNRLRTQAAAIAEETLEAVRAMPYEDIGISGGIPSGVLLASRDIEKDGTTFTVNTSIRYVDDAYDSQAPDDIVPSDYKQIQIEVGWPTNMEDDNIRLNTIISPPRMENILGTGVLIINTMDGEDAVPNCQVHIKNNDVDPAIDLETETDDNGSLTIPGTPPSTSKYEVTVSKSGYEEITTYPPFPDSPFNPLVPHLSVAEDQVTSAVFITDLLGQLSLQFNNHKGEAVPEIPFSLKGGRVIGTTVGEEPESVYAFDEDSLESDSNGSWENLELGKGPYHMTLEESNFELITTDPVLPWELPPNGEEEAEIILGRSTHEILVVRVFEQEEEEEVPIEEASVSVSKGDFSQEVLTDANGIAYFPQIEDPEVELTNGEEYDITVTKEEYNTEDTTATISNLTREDVTMTKE